MKIQDNRNKNNTFTKEELVNGNVYEVGGRFLFCTEGNRLYCLDTGIELFYSIGTRFEKVNATLVIEKHSVL